MEPAIEVGIGRRQMATLLVGGLRAAIDAAAGNVPVLDDTLARRDRVPGARSRWTTVVSSAIAEAETPFGMIAATPAVKTVGLGEPIKSS